MGSRSLGLVHSGLAILGPALYKIYKVTPYSLYGVVCIGLCFICHISLNNISIGRFCDRQHVREHLESGPETDSGKDDEENVYSRKRKSILPNRFHRGPFAVTTLLIAIVTFFWFVALGLDISDTITGRALMEDASPGSQPNASWIFQRSAKDGRWSNTTNSELVAFFSAQAVHSEDDLRYLTQSDIDSALWKSKLNLGTRIAVRKLYASALAKRFVPKLFPSWQ